MSDALVEFYETTDSVVNAAERFGNELAAMRPIESRCDEVTFRALDRAFRARGPVDALTVRALTNRLDEVTNAVEDAADRLVYMSHRG